MKTIRLLLLMAAMLSIACISCSKYEAEETNVGEVKDLQALPNDIDKIWNPIQSWTEHFSNQTALDANWQLYGKPSPKWVKLAYGKQGLFDNNGPSPTKNCAVSNLKVGKHIGYTVEGEVLLEILDSTGSCICPGIAVSRDLIPLVNAHNEIATSTSIKLVFAGDNATWFPGKLRGHTWLLMEIYAENGSVASSGYMRADEYANSWHKLKIEVTSARFVKFYCDNNLFWAPPIRLHPDMMNDKKVVLGYTSDGNPMTLAGVAYHNWVKVTFPVGPEF
jgi:hypothetical protein